ncbi:MAG: cysteine-rich CWC family protein [Rubrivivax sp.]
MPDTDNQPLPLDERCPRCGGGFHCGVNDAAPCPCSTLTLSAELQAELRQRYSGCLCLRCLAELASVGAAGIGRGSASA